MLLGGASGSPARVPLAELRHLPPTLKPEEAFALIGVGRTAGYEMIRRDEIPEKARAERAAEEAANLSLDNDAEA